MLYLAIKGQKALLPVRKTFAASTACASRQNYSLSNRIHNPHHSDTCSIWLFLGQFWGNHQKTSVFVPHIACQFLPSWCWIPYRSTPTGSPRSPPRCQWEPGHSPPRAQWFPPLRHLHLWPRVHSSVQLLEADPESIRSSYEPKGSHHKKKILFYEKVSQTGGGVNSFSFP